MITTHTTDRLDGRDATGERWAAHLAPATDDVPPLVAIRTIDGAAHLDADDATALYAWLSQLILDGHLDPTDQEHA